MLTLIIWNNYLFYVELSMWHNSVPRLKVNSSTNRPNHCCQWQVRVTVSVLTDQIYWQMHRTCWWTWVSDVIVTHSDVIFWQSDTPVCHEVTFRWHRYIQTAAVFWFGVKDLCVRIHKTILLVYHVMYWQSHRLSCDDMYAQIHRTTYVMSCHMLTDTQENSLCVGHNLCQTLDVISTDDFCCFYLSALN